MHVGNEDKILDISVNLARVSEWINSKNKQKRVDQFLEEIKDYLQTMSASSVSPRFKSTFIIFKKELGKLLETRYQKDREEWAERALTWANILQHRAKHA